MDLTNTYLMMNYLSGLNSASSINPLSTLYSGSSIPSASSLSGTLSFLEILQALQKDSQSSNVTKAASSASSEHAADSTYNSYSSRLSAGEAMDAMFDRAADKYEVDADLLKAIAKCESNFNADAVSSAGAIGIMQLMPGTARSLGVSDPYDAEQNIMGGAKYISQMLNRYDGDVELALAAYNAGPGNVDKYGGIPPFTETQNYVERVMGYLEADNSSLPRTIDDESAASTPLTSSFADTNTIEIETDTLITLYNLMRAQMELQLASNMFAWNTTDENDNGLLSL